MAKNEITAAETAAEAPAQAQKPKRKTHTSTAVKSRYNAKSYSRYLFTLRNADDAELIAAIEAERSEGMSDSALIKAILYDWQKMKSGRA